MTRKDYQALAGALYGVKIGDRDTRGRDELWLDTINAVACVLAADSPRFCRGTFIAACEDGNVGRRPKAEV